MYGSRITLNTFIRLSHRRLSHISGNVAHQSLTDYLPPAGSEHLKPLSSALFRDDERFTPVTNPDPLFQWDAIAHSIQARGLQNRLVDLKDLMRLKQEIDKISSQLRVLENERRDAVSAFCSSDNPISVRMKARQLKSERKYLKACLSELSQKFWKPALTLPNQLHKDCPLGIEACLVRSFVPSTIDHCNTIPWTSVASACHHTPIGIFLSGQLAQIERDLLTRARNYWMNPYYFDRRVSFHLVNLSDLVRGPAVEGCAWSPTEEVIQLQPSRNDLLGIQSAPHEMSYVVNPHTCSYLVGSASLAACTAYTMCQRLYTNSSFPVRIICPGSVYEVSNSPIESATESKIPRYPPYHQRKQLSLLELCIAEEAYAESIHRLVDDVFRFWTQFQPSWPLRLVYVPSNLLRSCEMLRAQVELATTSDQAESITLASVSVLDDWVSRRVSTTVRIKSSTDDDQVKSYARMTYAQLVDSRSVLNAFQQTGSLTHAA